MMLNSTAAAMNPNTLRPGADARTLEVAELAALASAPGCGAGELLELLEVLELPAAGAAVVGSGNGAPGNLRECLAGAG
jgi:hypothetical protein